MLKYKFTEIENKAILDYIYKEYGVNIEEIKSNSRLRIIIEAKRFYVVVLRRIFKLRTVKIGKLAKIHYSNVVHHCKKFDEMSEFYPKEYSGRFEELESRILVDNDYSDIQELINKRDILNNKINKLIIINSIHKVKNKTTNNNNNKKEENVRKERKELHRIKH